MKFKGKKKTVPIDNNYEHIKALEQFWNEMRSLFPDDFLSGLGTNWTTNKFDYYIGKIDESWRGGGEVVNLPDNGWQEFSCKEDDKDIEQMYRGIYDQGTLDYEIESMRDGIFTTRVHFISNESKAK